VCVCVCVCTYVYLPLSSAQHRPFVAHQQVRPAVEELIGKNACLYVYIE
jgi:hypothetical protein